MEDLLAIRNANGVLKGHIEIKPNGDKVVTDFMWNVLGYYRSFNDTTTDYNGRIISYGDTASGLIKLD